MNDEDDNSDCGPSLPAGVLRSRGGWEGESMEMGEYFIFCAIIIVIALEEDVVIITDVQFYKCPTEHQREALVQSGNNKAAHAAVDLSQFRNEEVGKGYQSKHVIRQSVAPSKTAKVVDMSSREHGSKPPPSETVAKETYLACRGMRDFIREVDKILQNP